MVSLVFPIPFTKLTWDQLLTSIIESLPDEEPIAVRNAPHPLDPQAPLPPPAVPTPAAPKVKKMASPVADDDDDNDNDNNNVVVVAGSGALAPPPAPMERLDFASVQPLPTTTDDPLAEAAYAKHHGRAARLEKMVRNVEARETEHEREQLATLLAGLRGTSWQRVMGINGCPAAERNLYARQRVYLIEATSALLAQYQRWREEERRDKEARARAGRERRRRGE